MMGTMVIVLKYIFAIAILWVIVMMPAYLARQTKRDGLAMLRVRIAGWLFSWTGAGWLWALFHAVRK